MSKCCMVIAGLLLMGPACYAQKVTSEKAFQQLLEIENQYSKIRQNCFAIISIETSTDKQSMELPGLSKLQYIYGANNSGSRRGDIAVTGDLLEDWHPDQWRWSRVIKKNGKVVLNLQGTLSGGSSESSEPSPVYGFDPLNATTCAWSSLLSGRCDETAFASNFLKSDIESAVYNRQGDLVITFLMGEKHGAIAKLTLGTRVKFLPTRCSFYFNKAENPEKNIEIGDKFSETETEWTKQDGRFVPKSISIVSDYQNRGTKRHQLGLTWIIDERKLNQKILFDESQIRERWDTPESIWIALTEP